jgi:hypothetical protein
MLAGVDSRYVYGCIGASAGPVLRFSLNPDASAGPETVYTYDAGYINGCRHDPGDGRVYVAGDRGIVAWSVDAQAPITGGAAWSPAVDGDYVYYATAASIRRVKKDGTGDAPVSPASVVRALVADALGLAWVNNDVSADGAWASPSLVLKRPSEAPESFPLQEPGSTLRTQIALTRRYVYYVDNGTLFRVRRDVPGAQPIRTGGWTLPNYSHNAGLVVSGDYVYWIPYSPTTEPLLRTPRCGGPTLHIGHTNAPWTGLFVANGYLYWFQANGGAPLLRIRP